MTKRPSLIDALDMPPAAAPAPSPEPAPTPAPPPKTKRDVHHTSIYIPRDAFERLREISFHERAKIHDLIMEGISRVIESRGHPERAAREK